jgi:(5-formylfuran-3-yl)methyl phosphate synthase
VARLLVSVRSADEARAAVQGGAAIIDVKEPNRGPLGRADAVAWSHVRAAVPESIPISVALGELSECVREDSPNFAGISFRKVGLAGSGEGWENDWHQLQSRWGEGPPWIAVVYADWLDAGSPHPDRVLDFALESGCAGILVDTWDKSRQSPVHLGWSTWFERARRRGLMTALAGRLDPEAIRRLAALHPDIIAVRGAACYQGDRRNAIELARVAHLAWIAEQLATEDRTS